MKVGAGPFFRRSVYVELRIGKGRERANELFARDFPIVCVGGSAGGSAAYVQLLKHLPPETGGCNSRR